jgi:hypothetical protein
MLVLRRKAGRCENALKAALISRAFGWQWVAYGDFRKPAGYCLCRHSFAASSCVVNSLLRAHSAETPHF